MHDIVGFVLVVFLLATLIWLYVDHYGWTLPSFQATAPSRSRSQTPHVSQPRHATPQSAPQNTTTSSQAVALVPHATQSVVSATPQVQRLPAVLELAHFRRETWRSGLFEGTFSRHVREGYERQAFVETLHLAEEAQRVRHRMEVREIAHVGALAAAHDAVIADATSRRERAAHLALTTREALEDHARKRVQRLEDAERTRREQLADHAHHRAQMIEDDQLLRPRVVAEQRFKTEVMEHEHADTREAWQAASADRARKRAEALDNYSRARPEEIAKQVFAAEVAQRGRNQTRVAWKEADEDRAITREETQTRRTRTARDEARTRRLGQAETAAKRVEAARTRRQVRATASRDDAESVQVAQYQLHAAIFPGLAEGIVSRWTQRMLRRGAIAVERWAKVGINRLRLTTKGREVLVARNVPVYDVFTPRTPTALKDVQHTLWINDLRVVLPRLSVPPDVIAPAWLLQRQLGTIVPDVLAVRTPRSGDRGYALAVEVDLGGERLKSVFLPKLARLRERVGEWAGGAPAIVLVLTRGERRILALRASLVPDAVPVLVQSLPVLTGRPGLQALQNVLAGATKPA